MDSKELQRLFLDFFHSHDHPIIPSSSVVPYNDNTLLFTNSGMVQFKKLFSMTPSSLPYTSATSSQHCIRAGGKHNDLDDVGKDSYHHTFFFMLGNWSFGNYFKEQAISYAYDFLTNVLNLDKKRIYVSYYKTETECDNETLEIWKRYVPLNRILPFDEKDNFWEMGDTGPCGPCTEIHYDCRKVDEDASHLVNMDHPDVIEIWNIVFIQYFRNQDRSFSTLPMKCIDTGMGMERVLRIVNKLDSNYLTDSFVKIMCEIEKCILKENQGKNEKNEDNTSENKSYEITANKTEDITKLRNSDEKTENNKVMTSDNKTGLILYRDVYDTKDPDFRQAMAMRVIADHSRTIAVCLKDGVTFSSDGRGYVLRRIMRRAIKYCNELRLTNKMSKFVRIAAESIGIEIDNEKIEMVENEEKLFLRTLENGKKILLKHKGTLSGKDAFMLYDTYGFPFDLTEIYCAENNVKVDKEGFEKIKNEMREKSKKKEKGDEKLSFDVIDFLRKYEVTDDKYKYLCDSMDANLLCVIRDNKIIYDKFDNVHKSDEVCINDTLYLLFDKTCFYSECGGQVGDTGVIEYKDIVFEVLDTQKYNNYVLHTCKTNKFTIDNNAFECKLKVNIDRRESIKKNHTATHLLNHALRCKFENIEQKGSLVDDKKLRFDFTKSKGLTIDEIKEIEKYINQLIENGIPVIAKEESFANIGDNVILLKEEKYPESVRVINIKDTSSELCGGTHVNNTSEITQFRIVSEGSISNNVRRIVACTGIEALRIENNLKCKNALDLEIPLIEKLSMLELQKEKEKEQQSMRKQILNDNIKRLKEEYKNGNNTRIKCDNVGFIFECDFKGCDSKMVVKDLNSIGGVFDKEKITGVLYAITEENVNFAIRGENALERGKIFCEQLIDGVVNGKDKCANGKGTRFCINYWC